MDESELRARLPKALTDRLEDLRRECLSETGSLDIDRFLVWLHDEGHLGTYEFQELVSDDPIAVTTLRRSADQRHYEVIGMLGKGAMGCVHIAKDVDLQRKVAYKTQNDRHGLARFVREAQITAQLDHPNVVPVYGMEVRPDGSVGYSMKLVRGKTFKDLIREARAAFDKGEAEDAEHRLSQLLDYFLKACDAVAFAHSRRVIHRDLKPANIMVGPYNEVYVVDWGIARVVDDDEIEVGPEEETIDIEPEERTRAGAVLGTPCYMAPEQAAGKNAELDGRSDEFCLGLILYELLTLRRAFNAPSLSELFEKVRRADKDPWTGGKSRRKVHPELAAIVDRATALRPEDRYRTVAEMAEDVRRHLRGEAPSARPDNAWRKASRWIGRHRELALLAVAAIVVCAAAVVVTGMVRHQHELDRARQREEALLQFVRTVSERGQRLDRNFQKMESLLLGLGKAATYALTHGEPSDDPLYVNDPYAKPPRKLFDAPDLIPSPFYTGEISTTWPTFSIAPGVDVKAITPKLRRMASLRKVLKDVLVESYTDGPPPPKEEWDEILANRGVPLMWSYVCLKEGVELWYPGHDEPTKGYDPRVRSYFRQSYEKHEVVWGVPYDDLVGGLLIPCTQGIFDEEGTFLGTVGVDMSISYVDKKFLRMPGAAAFEKGYLLNEKGEIVLQTGAPVKPKRRLGMREQNVLKLYPRPKVVQAIVARDDGGMLDDDAEGDRRIVVYDRLDTLGWYYVVEADAAKIVAQ